MGKKRFSKATEIRTATDTYKLICEEIVDAWWSMTDVENWLEDEGYDYMAVNWAAYPNIKEMLEPVHLTDNEEDLKNIYHTLERMLSGNYYEEPEAGYDTTDMIDYISGFRDRKIDIMPIYFNEKSRVWKAYMTYLGVMGKVELANEFVKAYQQFDNKESIKCELQKRELYSDVEKALAKI